MSVVRYKLVPHDHVSFMLRALARKGFKGAYDALVGRGKIGNRVAARVLRFRT